MTPSSHTKARLGKPELRQMIEKIVRRRVPPSDIDDVVQTVLVDALASDNVPDDDVELRKWVVGIARHKVADFHRKGGRVKQVELGDDIADEPSANSARDLARWAGEQVADNRDAQRTLEWMEREGQGEKLAHIAAEEKLPPDQVRQRVSRLRRFMRERWAAELAAVAAVVAAAFALWWIYRDPSPIARPEPIPHKTPEITPIPPPSETRELPAEKSPAPPIPSAAPSASAAPQPSVSASASAPAPKPPTKSKIDKPAPKPPTKSKIDKPAPPNQAPVPDTKSEPAPPPQAPLPAPKKSTPFKGKKFIGKPGASEP